ncbi:MAG: hypothetical protein FWC27_03535 [Firmicutes bacterium]|nr:hypothetical protein [Bacillota bacterium]
MRKLDPNEVFAKCALMEWKECASPAELEEFERWSAWLSAENKKAARREYRYRGHIDKYCDITLADGDGEDEEDYLDEKRLARLGYESDLLEDYLSTSPESIHELISDAAISAAVKRCTLRQKEALHCCLIPRIKTADVALILGTSDRNVLKLLATARKNILNEIGETK